MKIRLGVGCILDGIMFGLGQSSSGVSGTRPWEFDQSDESDNGEESMKLKVNKKEYDPALVISMIWRKKKKNMPRDGPII